MTRNHTGHIGSALRTAVRSNRFASRARGNAFTLIELLLVMVILAVLAAVVVPKFTKRTTQAKETAAKATIANLKLAINSFEIDTGRYPTSEEGLEALLASSLQGWHGPYVEGNQVPKDPWGRPYIYRAPGQHNTTGYDLYSLGEDGQEGNDDIGNW